MGRIANRMLAGAALAAAAPLGAQAPVSHVYAFCTVEAVPRDGDVAARKVHRSDIFVAPAGFDRHGGISEAFGEVAGEARGASCTEAPLTPEGATAIVALRNGGDQGGNPDVELILSSWRPAGMGATTSDLQRARVAWRLRENDDNWRRIQARDEAARAAKEAELARQARVAADDKAALERWKSDVAAIEAANEATRREAAAIRERNRLALDEYERRYGGRGR